MFTMAEYIAEHKLNVSPHDPTATRIIGKHLTELGYVKRRVKRDGKFQLVWSNEPRPDYEKLRETLQHCK